MTLLVQGENATPLPPPPKRFRYHVLFSYRSADEEYVGAVHAALPKEVRVFNYKEDVELWGTKLEKELERRYKNDAPFCVVFISQAYLAGRWTKQELAIVHRVDQRKRGYMLPVVLDDTIVPEIHVPEIKDLVWLDKKTLTPDALAKRLDAKIRQPPPMPWWFYVSTRVKVAAAAVILALILFFLPSDTELKSVNANEQAIIAHLVNRGPKIATIVGKPRLKFGTLPIEDAELSLDSRTILPGWHDVKLISHGLDTKCDADGIRPNNDAAVALLGQQKVTLEINVQESDDAPGHSTLRRLPFPAERLKPFVQRLVANDVPDC